MIEISITDECYQKSEKRAKELGKIKNSITNGEGNLAGFIGEQVVSDYYNFRIENTYDYDLLDACGRRIDVKTKRTTVKPKDYYECSIAAYNTSQNCDAYFFVRVSKDMKLAWILGYKMKNAYFKEAKFLKKGQVDPDNNFTVKADCYNIPISKLDQL